MIWSYSYNPQSGNEVAPFGGPRAQSRRNRTMKTESELLECNRMASC